MQYLASLRRLGFLLLVVSVAALLPGCGSWKIERTDANGNTLHKKHVDKPVVGTHVSPPARR